MLPITTGPFVFPVWLLIDVLLCSRRVASLNASIGGNAFHACKLMNCLL